MRSKSTFRTYLAFQFRAEWRTTIFWTVGLCVYAGLVVSIYPSVRSAVNLDAIPPNLRAAFNITDFTQLASFLSTQLLGVILPIVLPFYGMIMLSNVVAGAEERGRLDILLGNPIPRSNLIVGMFFVAATYLLAIVFVIGLVIWSVASLQNLALNLPQTLRATFTLWPLSIAFGALALAVSTVARQRAVALGVPAVILFLMYLLNVIGRLAPSISWVRYASAYNYYGTAIIDGIWWTGVIVLLTSTILLLVFAVVAFSRRDIFA